MRSNVEALLISLMCLVVLSCTETRPQSCEGCQGADGTCELGNTYFSCGLNGAACVTCKGQEVCQFGSCIGPNQMLTGGGTAGGEAGGTASGGGMAGGQQTRGGDAGGGFAGGAESGGGAAGGLVAGGTQSGGGIEEAQHRVAAQQEVDYQTVRVQEPSDNVEPPVSIFKAMKTIVATAPRFANPDVSAIGVSVKYCPMTAPLLVPFVPPDSDAIRSAKSVNPDANHHLNAQGPTAAAMAPFVSVNLETMRVVKRV